MEIYELLISKREEIIHAAALRGARNIRVFGSVVRGDAQPDSDIDFLVDLDSGRSLLDLGGLLMDLQIIIGRDVDIVTEKGLHWYIRDQVLAEAIDL